VRTFGPFFEKITNVLRNDAQHRRLQRALDVVNGLDAGIEILDEECQSSEGVFTEILMKAHPGAEITGIDISERALARARHRIGDTSRVRFEQADILGHRVVHRFDLVVCAETLYYLGRDDRLRHASAQLCRLLAPGGLLVLAHPWPESRRLHRHIAADTAVSAVTEHIDTRTHRPFSVALYQAGPLGEAAGLSA
jgi:trans-aconitate methyltransferase